MLDRHSGCDMTRSNSDGLPVRAPRGQWVIPSRTSCAGGGRMKTSSIGGLRASLLSEGHLEEPVERGVSGSGSASPMGAPRLSLLHRAPSSPACSTSASPDNSWRVSGNVHQAAGKPACQAVDVDVLCEGGGGGVQASYGIPLETFMSQLSTRVNEGVGESRTPERSHTSSGRAARSPGSPFAAADCGKALAELSQTSQCSGSLQTKQHRRHSASPPSGVEAVMPRQSPSSSARHRHSHSPAAAFGSGKELRGSNTATLPKAEGSAPKSRPVRSRESKEPSVEAPATSPEDTLQAAYNLLMEKMESPASSSALPSEIRQTRQALVGRRRHALWRAMAALEDLWATDRALLQLESFDADVVRLAGGASPITKRTAAAERYLGIHKKVLGWGEEDCQRGPPPYCSTTWLAANSPTRRMGARMESTAAPGLSGASSAAAAVSGKGASPPPTRVSPVEGQLQHGTGPGPEAEGTLGARRCGESGFVEGAALPSLSDQRRRLNAELKSAILKGTEPWFIDNVARELCTEAVSASNQSYDSCLATLKVLKKLQSWADLAADLPAPDGGSAGESLRDLKSSLRDAVIRKGSELAVGAS